MTAKLQVGCRSYIGRGSGYASFLFFEREFRPLLFALATVNLLAVHFPPLGETAIGSVKYGVVFVDNCLACWFAFFVTDFCNLESFTKEDASFEEVTAKVFDSFPR